MKTFTSASNEDLIKLYISGNSDALAALVTRYREKIYTSIYMLVKDKLLAEDIFQDVFLRIIDTINAGKYNEEGKFLPWAMRIAHNMSVDHFRRIKRNPPIVNSDNFDIFEVLNFSESTTEDKIVEQETATKIRKMLDKIPADQREIIILRHYAGLSFKEIARLTHCSINTALGRMRYGLLNLRKMVTEGQIAF
jgi:RNA polymerase sigma-70 factor (ECF subfamily)